MPPGQGYDTEAYFADDEEAPPKPKFKEVDPEALETGMVMLDDLYADEPDTDKLAAADKAQDGSDPEVKQIRSMIMEDPKQLFRISEAEKEQTGSRVNTMGALLSLALPMLVGAAVGGKRGTLHAAKGAGTGAVHALERAADEEKEIRKAEAAEKVWLRRNEIRNEQINAREARRNKAKYGEDAFELKRKQEGILHEDKLKREERSQNRKDYTAMEKEIRPLLDNGRNILKEIGEYKDNGTGLLEWQVSKRFSATEAGKLQRRLGFWTIGMTKAMQGSRASDLDLRAIKDAIQGDWTADPKTSYDLLSNILNDFEEVLAVRKQVLLDPSYTPTTRQQKLLDESDKRAEDPVYNEIDVASEETMAELERVLSLAEEANVVIPIATARARLQKKELPPLSDDALELLGFVK